MENLQWRAMAALVVSLLVLLLWEYFIGVPTPSPPALPKAQQERQAGQAGAAAPVEIKSAPATPATPAAPHPARDVVVTTPLYRAVFTEQGARLKSFQLLNYRERVGPDSPPKELVCIQNPADLPLGLDLLKPPLDTSRALFTASSLRLDLNRPQAPQAEGLSFELTDPSGVRLIKRFEFRPDLYRIDLAVRVQNLSGQALEAEPALNLVSGPFSSDDGYYRQAAVMVGGEVETEKAGDLEQPKLIRGNVRWAAYDEPFFVAALAPAPGEPVNVRLASQGALVSESLISPPSKVGPGQERTYRYSLYYGPKELAILTAQGLELEKVIHYGWFDIIAKPLLVVLKWIHGFVHNWGLAIIVLTVLIKLAFWPLSQKSYRSMKEMQKLQPKLAALKEKHKGDTTKLNQEMLTLYRTYKVNPMGGCLPMLAQIPVFIALYQALQYSIELRHAPFLLWINDLSAPDRLAVGFDIPYVGGLPVLTLLMGASMWLQQKMTPVTGDPAQAKMMQLLPLVFTFMFIYFPAGLVLYWLVNNILSIGQQYYINRTLA